MLPPRGVVHAYEPADLAGDYAGFEAAERYFLEKARRIAGFGWEAGETTEAGPFVVLPFRLTDAAGSEWWQLAVYRVENERIAEAWLHEWRADDGSPKLVRVHISPRLGAIPLVLLSAAEVQAFLNERLAAGKSPRTVQYLHAILRSALGQAWRWGMVPRNVGALVDPPRVQRREIQPLTSAEARLLLAHVRDDRLEALYTVALAVGLRQGEALGLRWDDVDLDGRTLSAAAVSNVSTGHCNRSSPRPIAADGRSASPRR